MFIYIPLELLPSSSSRMLLHQRVWYTAGKGIYVWIPIIPLHHRAIRTTYSAKYS